METQNLVISFDYSWFLAKNLAYDECWIMKFHYRNSSTAICPPFLLVPPALQTNTAYLVLLMLGCRCCKKTKLSRCMQTFHKASWLPHINITTDKTSRSLILGQFKYESLLMTQWMSRLFDHDKYTVYRRLFFCTIMLLWPLPIYVRFRRELLLSQTQVSVIKIEFSMLVKNSSSFR